MEVSVVKPFSFARADRTSSTTSASSASSIELALLPR
jgi:hypothetical protein